MNRWAGLEVLPAARHYGLGVIPWSPLHGGVLGGVLRKQKEGAPPAATLGDREVVGAMLVAGAVTGNVHWVPLAERVKGAGSLVDTPP
ncbi:hypothetical protein [Streptosporangium roseum]|uniref:hypothetical protein n=1 Tax=Streptosporangium roseum TaxID=2001 RepID=UPI003316B364